MTLSGLLIGGIIPAVGLGLSTVFLRASLDAGASMPPYLAVVGSIVTLFGWKPSSGRAARRPLPSRCCSRVALGALLVCARETRVRNRCLEGKRRHSAANRSRGKAISAKVAGRVRTR